MYKVIYKFADLQDDNYVYNVGDDYPRSGYAPSEKRISELAGKSNKIGKALIEKIEVKEEKPIEEKPKTNKRKKADTEE